MTTTEASIEESEIKTRLIESLRQRRHQCVYGQRLLTTTAAAAEEKIGPKDSETTTEASEKDKGYVMCLRDRRK